MFLAWRVGVWVNYLSSRLRLCWINLTFFLNVLIVFPLIFEFFIGRFITDIFVHSNSTTPLFILPFPAHSDAISGFVYIISVKLHSTYFFILTSDLFETWVVLSTWSGLCSKRLNLQNQLYKTTASHIILHYAFGLIRYKKGKENKAEFNTLR